MCGTKFCRKSVTFNLPINDHNDSLPLLLCGYVFPTNSTKDTFESYYNYAMFIDDDENV